MDTALQTRYRRGVVTTTTLRDFEIEGAAEVGGCLGAQSFRATRYRDGQPVLLHKFRPAESLLALGPLIGREEPPDFTQPFVTQFTSLFVVAGSAYLVEPLPPCFALSDLWRYVLLQRPQQAYTVSALVVRQLLTILRRLRRHNRHHGALHLENIVLAPTARFGILTGHLPCRDGRLWLRKNPESPVKPDTHALADLLTRLLDMEAEIATLQNVPTLLPVPVRHRIHTLRRAVEPTTISTNSP
jgi:hypothetical protein